MICQECENLRCEVITSGLYGYFCGLDLDPVYNAEEECEECERFRRVEDA